MPDKRDLVMLLTHVALGVERSAVLLAQVNRLHQELADLHAEISEAAVELEEILKRLEPHLGETSR